MQKPVATLEPNQPDTLPHPSAPRADVSPSAPARSLGRFQYASGDCPLAGYTIKRGVGQGGFGEIYYAQSDAGKDVALKLIRRNLEVELRGIRQCLNLKHPHLLDLYDIRQDDRGDAWVVMEFIADQNLEDVLATRPNGLPPDEALAWLRGIGAGVAYLHDRGIVHRDLKPGNIFCDEGVVKVGDYGLSKFISCSRRSGHTESIGTVHYMAPEVANGRYGKEIDVYAMGVILYELLTGRVPFEGESIGEVLMKHLTARPDVSMLPEPYRGVVARAMEKDPTLRFRSAADMLAALPTPTEIERNGVPRTVSIHHPARNASHPERNASHPERSEGSPADPDEILRCAQDDDNRETIVAAHVVREEPILRAVRQQVRNLRDALYEAKRQTPGLYVLLVVGMVLAMIHLGPAVIVLSFVLCAVYGIYRLLWTLLGGNATSINSRGLTAPGGPTPSVFCPSARPAAPLAPQRYGWVGSREQAAAALVLKPWRQRLAELIGSMLGSTLVAAAMCVVVVLIESFRADAPGFPRPEQFAWLLLVSVAGSWAVLIPSKFWEGVRGDATTRRFWLMVIGMGVGVAAFYTSEFLLVSLPQAAGYPKPLALKLPPSFYAVDGHPQLMAYAACFGTLLLLIRWWLQADPLRRSRLSLWSLASTIVVAGVVAWAWQFPQPWLPMIAGVISVSVQLASPWRRPGRRW